MGNNMVFRRLQMGLVSILCFAFVALAAAAGATQPAIVAKSGPSLVTAAPIVPDGPRLGGDLNDTTPTLWFSFTVPSESYYKAELHFVDYQVGLELFGPNSPAKRIAGIKGNPPYTQSLQLCEKLKRGVYYLKVTRMIEEASPFHFSLVLTHSVAGYVTDFRLNAPPGQTVLFTKLCYERQIQLVSRVLGRPVQYLASTDRTFAGATWRKYDDVVGFTLPAVDLWQEVYFKIRDVHGNESPVVVDICNLHERELMKLNQPFSESTRGEVVTAFDVDHEDEYVVRCQAPVSNTIPLFRIALALHGPAGNDQMISSRLIEKATAATVGARLKKGRYYAVFDFETNDIDLSHYPGSAPVFDHLYNARTTVTLTASPYRGQPQTSDLNVLPVEGGYFPFVNREVVLKNVSIGRPRHYLASESRDFAGARWKDYSAAPKFKLSAACGSKTIYFMVKDASGNVSNVTSQTITYTEPTPLEVGHAPLTLTHDTVRDLYCPMKINHSGRYTLIIKHQAPDLPLTSLATLFAQGWYYNSLKDVASDQYLVGSDHFADGEFRATFDLFPGNYAYCLFPLTPSDVTVLGGATSETVSVQLVRED